MGRRKNKGNEASLQRQNSSKETSPLRKPPNGGWTPDYLQRNLKNHYGNGLKIKRLFYPNSPISIHKHYINLSILTGGDYQRKLDECARKSVEEKGKEEEYDYYAHLYGQEKETITPEQIMFMATENKAKRILVLGTAGIGKSTLSEYLCYLWGSSRINSINLHFLLTYQWVFRISLRNLTIENYSNEIDVIDVIEKECLVPMLGLAEPFLSATERDKLTQRLEQAREKQQVLFIIDGFDEIPDNNTPSLLKVIQKLLAFNNVIVTSRPYNLFELRQTYQFKENILFEITGFTEADIQRYVAVFFEHLPEKKTDEIHSFLEFLHRNKNIAGACRIPINLELLCSAWDKQPIPQGTYSVTTIYELVTNSLCRRYLERKSEQVRNKSDQEVLETCLAPLTFLDYLGYQSIDENKLFFKLDSSQDYLKKIGLLQDNIFLQQKAFGFIRPNNPSGEYDGGSFYYFNHLTFRDYFASRFFVVCLQSMLVAESPSRRIVNHHWKNVNPDDFSLYLERHCFEQRFEFVWCFMVGLLDAARDKRGLEYFFNHVLMGGNTAPFNRCLLFIRCLDEVKELADELSPRYWDYITMWLNMAFKPGFSILLIAHNSPMIERLKISARVFAHEKIQSFFCKKIQKMSSLKDFIKLLEFFYLLKHPLPERVKNTLLETLLKHYTADGLSFEDVVTQKLIARFLAFLCQHQCLNIRPFIDLFLGTDTTPTQRALAGSVGIIVQQSAQGALLFTPDEQEQWAKQFDTLFKDKQRPLIEHCALTSLFGPFEQVVSYLVLEQQKGHYLSIHIPDFLSQPDAVIQSLVNELISQGPRMDFELIKLVQQSKAQLFFAPPFAQAFLTEREVAKKLQALWNWLLAIRQTQTLYDSGLGELILKELSDLLLTSSLETHKTLFLSLLEELMMPSPLVMTIFLTVREKLLLLFSRQFHTIKSPSIKKYIAVSIACSTNANDSNYIEVLNVIINNTYTDVELKRLFPKSMNQFNLRLMNELTFCSRDCTSYLKQLNFTLQTDSLSLLWVISRTPIEPILQLIKKNIDNSIRVKPLMSAVLLRHIQLGKVIYFNEEGLYYFATEYQKYQVFFVATHLKFSFQALLKECGVSFPTLPTLSAQSSFSSGVASLVSDSSLIPVESVSASLQGTISMGFPKEKEALPSIGAINHNYHIYASNSSIAVGGQSQLTYPDSRGITQKTFPTKQSLTPLITQGENLMLPLYKRPSYAEYALMSDYAYLDGTVDEQKALLSKLNATQKAGISEGWRVIDYPEGAFTDGYVGAVFIHPVRCQIVVAHAGTLPTRLKTVLADASSVVLQGADPLVLGALMQSQGSDEKAKSLQHLMNEEGYQLSFTGHSLGGFLAEMSVYACHRGFGLTDLDACAVVFDSPGSLEVMKAWESHLGIHAIDLTILNIISFLSSPNLVNTMNHHPGTVYRLIRPLKIATFTSYLLESHDRKKLFELFDGLTGLPIEHTCIEMEDWPLANYEELLSLKECPISGPLDLLASKTIDFMLGLGQKTISYLNSSTQKVSPWHLFGGRNLKNWWELWEKESPSNYHLLFDTATQEGLAHAVECHYTVKRRREKLRLTMKTHLPLVNIRPPLRAFLTFHEEHAMNPLYQRYIKDSGLNITLPPYHVDVMEKIIYLQEEQPDNTIFNLIGMVDTLFNQQKEIMTDWGKNYLQYVHIEINDTRNEVGRCTTQINQLKSQHTPTLNLTRAQHKLKEAQTRLELLEKNLKAFEEINSHTSSDESMRLFMLGSAYADKKGSTSQATVRITEQGALAMMEKSQKLLKQEREEDRKDNRPASKKNITSFFSAMAMEEGAISRLDATFTDAASTHKAQSLLSVTPLSSSSSDFFVPAGTQSTDKRGAYCDDKGENIFRVMIHYGQLGLSKIQADQLQPTLNSEWGTAAFDYIENSTQIKNGCITQLELSDKETAEILVQKIKEETLRLKQPALTLLLPSTLSSSSTQEGVVYPKS